MQLPDIVDLREGAYPIAFSGGTKLRVTVYLEPEGKIEQLLVESSG